MTSHKVNCRSIDEWSGAYLDGELEEEARDQVETHLQNCPTCRKSVNREQSVRTLLRVRRNNLREAAPVLLREAVLVRLDEFDEKRRGRRVLVWAGSVAVTALLIVSFGIGRIYEDGMTEHRSVVVETVNEHIRCLLSPGVGLDVGTKDRESAEEWFRSKVDFPVAIPQFEATGLGFRGGRLCYLLDRRVAYLHYQRGDDRFSLFVMDPAGLRLPAGKDVTVGGRRICITSRKGYSLALWEADGLIYALVAGENPDRLVEIAVTAARQS